MVDDVPVPKRTVDFDDLFGLVILFTLRGLSKILMAWPSLSPLETSAKDRFCVGVGGIV